MRSDAPIPESDLEVLGLDQHRKNGHQEVVIPQTFTAAELMAKEFPPVREVVPGVLPEGVTILGGKPKIGKSWLSMDIGLGIASGGYVLGKVKVEQGTVLIMALEDNERRLQKRIRLLTGDRPVPEDLHMRLDWRKIGEGGADDLDVWLTKHPDTRLVVIDTLKKIRPRVPGNRSIYDVDYEALEPLIPLASTHNVAIMPIHHLRKMAAADPLEELSGSTGLSGGADGAAIMRRTRGKNEATLYVTGRDLEEERELALVWDQELASWTLAGDAQEYNLSQERKKILELLRNADGPVSAKDIAEVLDKNYSTTRVLMSKMIQDGQVEKRGNAGYVPYEEV